MKIRNGFVSNSSSSSFVIAVKNNKLKDLLDDMQSEMLGKLKSYPSIFTDVINDIFRKFRDVEEIDLKYEIDDDYDGNENAFWNDNNGLKKLIDSGYTVYKVDVSSDDYEDMGQYLYQNIESLRYKSKDKNLIITDDIY